ncbi:hypothetical protein D3C72_1222490 [compost metagenome]
MQVSVVQTSRRFLKNKCVVLGVVAAVLVSLATLAAGMEVWNKNYPPLAASLMSLKKPKWKHLRGG